MTATIYLSSAWLRQAIANQIRHDFGRESETVEVWQSEGFRSVDDDVFETVRVTVKER